MFCFIDKCWKWLQRGSEYRGTANSTKSGFTCQTWKFTDTVTPQKFPNAGLLKNFCRNPDNDNSPHGPWCYVNSSKATWEYCGIKICIG